LKNRTALLLRFQFFGPQPEKPSFDFEAAAAATAEAAAAVPKTQP
jgi:hypothetical protein